MRRRSTLGMLGDLASLTSVFEFLPLVEIISCSNLNRHWNFTASVCPMAVIDTVGMAIPLDRLIHMISSNRRNVTILRMSVTRANMDALILELEKLMPEMTRLNHLSIFTAHDDGSVTFNFQALTDIDKHSLTKEDESGLKSLVLGCDPAIPSVRTFMSIHARTLSTLAFLRGCHTAFKTEVEIAEFLESQCDLASVRCLHLGACSSSMDMDPLIALLLTQCESLRYVQWTGAGASLDMMKSIMSKKPIECAFEGVGFLSLFMGL